MRRLFAIAVCAALSACGSADLVLVVTSARRVPGDIDTLRITITDSAQTGILRSLTVPLDKPFPATILFTPHDETPSRVRIQVEARLGSTTVTTVSTESSRDMNDDTTITIRLDGSVIDYDPHDWWFNFFAVRGTMLGELSSRVFICTVAATAVAFASHRGYEVAIPPTAHTLVGVALGLLLVIRTNASYDRFWEGRKLWGSIVNASRNLLRGASALYAGEALFDELKLWVRVFPYACMHTLRGSNMVLPAGLPRDEEAAVLASPSAPVAVALRMSKALKAARDRGLVTDIQQMELDRGVAQLVDAIGACERIHKTPLPFAYVVHLRRALVLYCLTLPFALVGPMHFWSVLAVVLIAFVLFGIEEIGVEIEDPFGTDPNDLPLESICDTIDKNLAAL